MPAKTKILFLCTGNSCRSQMAEGWARHLKGDAIEPFSAGLIASGLNPYAVKAMAEAGVDTTRQTSKTLDSVMNNQFDYVVTVCADAHETCPLFPAKAKVIHKGFNDPPRLSANEKTEEGTMAHYRRVRDQIRDYVRTLPEALGA